MEHSFVPAEQFSVTLADVTKKGGRNETIGSIQSPSETAGICRSIFPEFGQDAWEAV
jgi:hypothetical protein